MDGEKEREMGGKDTPRKSGDRSCSVKKIDGERERVPKREENNM